MLSSRGILDVSLASIFGLFVLFVAVVFTLNVRRSRRQEEGLAGSSSAHSRPETVYITACVWLFIPAATARSVLLFISAVSNSDYGLNSIMSIEDILVIDIAAFSLFTFCKLLLSSAIFKYLYAMINIDLNKFLRSEGSINVFLVVLVPFFLTVITSAVLWSYQIFNASLSTSNGDLIVHSDLSKNHSAPAPTPGLPDDTNSLSQDIYLVSSYHFITLSAVIAFCCLTGALFVARWKRLRERSPGSSTRNPLGFNSDAQQLAVRLQWINFAFFLTSVLRLAFNVVFVIYPGSFQSIMQQLQAYPSLYQGALDLVLEALPITIAIVISSTICSEECSALVALGLRDEAHSALLHTPR